MFWYEMDGMELPLQVETWCAHLCLAFVLKHIPLTKTRPCESSLQVVLDSGPALLTQYM